MEQLENCTFKCKGLMKLIAPNSAKDRLKGKTDLRIIVITK